MNTLSSYCNNLINTVLRCSNATKWRSAVLKWRIDNVQEDETLSDSCIFRKENLRYLFRIRSLVNG